MQLLIRTLFIWLLVFAVPAQGAAAATMALCGPSHHRDAAAAQGQANPLAEHAFHVGSSLTAHEQLVPTVQSEQHDSLSASAAAPSKASSADKHKCSACASCCSAGAILNAVLSMPPPGVALTLFADVVAAVDAFATDGPDRPPRLVLA